MNICLICSKEFEADKPERKFCSRECYFKSRIGHTSKLRKRIVKTCEYCGKEFETGGRSGKIEKRFCSWECMHGKRYIRSPKQAKTMMREDAIYMAGFIDGEGSIMVVTKRKRIGVRLNATNTKFSILRWIQEVTGVGNITRYNGNNPKHAPHGLWQANGEAAYAVLEQIRPFLKLKQAQCDLAIEVMRVIRDKTKPSQEWQEDVFLQARALNAKGIGD